MLKGALEITDILGKSTQKFSVHSRVVEGNGLAEVRRIQFHAERRGYALAQDRHEADIRERQKSVGDKQTQKFEGRLVDPCEGDVGNNGRDLEALKYLDDLAKDNRGPDAHQG